MKGIRIEGWISSLMVYGMPSSSVSSLSLNNPARRRHPPDPQWHLGVFEGVRETGATTTWADIRAANRYDANSDIGFGKSSFLDPASGYDPFAVRNGALTITGVPYTVRSGYPGSWQSGLIHSRQSFVQSYGYFEMRAKFNSVPGTWPAFWLLPATTLHPAGRNGSLWPWPGGSSASVVHRFASCAVTPSQSVPSISRLGHSTTSGPSPRSRAWSVPRRVGMDSCSVSTPPR